ncbi:MAG: DUF6220 domain-containing protein [Rhizobiaceae bacterium]|nr:DUF6220 domain-containing protein [Rhizobiaceae bacterium]
MKMHDTFADLALGTPFWFTLSARILPIGLLGQFLSAGAALFRNANLWSLHTILGASLLISSIILLGGALLVRRLRGFAWWSGLVFVLYLAQIGLAAGTNPLMLSFHPFNGAMLLAGGLILLAKTERRRARSVHLTLAE